MKPTSALLKAVRVKSPVSGVTRYDFPALSSISSDELVNSNFGKGTYFVHKTQFGHWPVYKKVQNTKITTEIKRIQGDVHQFKADLLSAMSGFPAKNITVNSVAGYVNVKGDRVQQVMQILDEKHCI